MKRPLQSFLMAVLASMVAYYLCQILDNMARLLMSN